MTSKEMENDNVPLSGEIAKSSKNTNSDSEVRDYKPFFCGNSIPDLFFVNGAVIGIWIIAAAFWSLLLHGALQTDESHALLWTFFGLFFVCVALLGTVLCISSKNNISQDGELEETQDA